MIHTRQADCPALVRDSIMQEQMTGVHLDADAVAIQNENAKFTDGV
jgi:hypothetical protein